MPCGEGLSIMKYVESEHTELKRTMSDSLLFTAVHRHG